MKKKPWRFDDWANDFLDRHPGAIPVLIVVGAIVWGEMLRATGIPFKQLLGF